MRPIDLLDLMLADMDRADQLFRPTHFWETGIGPILEDLRTRGFSDFRSHPSAHLMYVPEYRHPRSRDREAAMGRLTSFASRITPGVGRLLADHLSGAKDAEADYRVFAASSTSEPPDLERVTESPVGEPQEQFTFNGAKYSRSMLNYLRGLNFVKRHADVSGLTSAVEIGGGYGTLGEILLQAVPGSFYLNVDIPPLAAVSTYYLREVFGDGAVLEYDRSRKMDVLDVDEMRTRWRAAVICPWQLPKLQGSFDMFVNFISFQEMEPRVIANYVSLVQPRITRCVLLRNSRTGKQEVTGSELGVRRATPMDTIIAAFDAFTCAGRDALVFGQQTGASVSEVACLVRDDPGAS